MPSATVILPAPALSQGRVTFYACLALLAAVICVYSAAVRADFVGLDDHSYLVDNPLVRDGLTGPALVEAWTQPHASLWIPLTWMSLMLDVSIFGLHPGAMHAVNIAWHALATMLLFLALRRLTGERWPSLAVAALWALHPQNVESVAWVTERKNVLCAAFSMLTLLAYARYAERPGVGRYLAVLGSLFLALASKPMAVTLPCVLFLLDLWPLRRHERVAWGRLLLEKMPLFVLVAVTCWIALSSPAAQVQVVPFEVLPLAPRISNALLAYPAYLGQLFWPAGFAVFYPHPLRVQWLPALAAGVFLLAVTGLTVWQFRRRPFLLVGWLWFLGVLVPMIGLVQAGSVARADRFMYFASLGVLIAVVWLARELIPLVPPRVPVLLLGASLAILAGLTARQVAFWDNSVTLFQHSLAVTGPLARLEGLLAYAYEEQDDYPEAVLHFKKAILIQPTMSELWNDLGAAYSHLNKSPEAAQCFRNVLYLDPSANTARYNLANVLAQLGAKDEAIAQYRQLVGTVPDFGRAQLHLGLLLAAEGRAAEAAPHLQAARRLLPGDPEVAAALARLPPPG